MFEKPSTQYSCCSPAATGIYALWLSSMSRVQPQLCPAALLFAVVTPPVGTPTAAGNWTVQQLQRRALQDAARPPTTRCRHQRSTLAATAAHPHNVRQPGLALAASYSLKYRSQTPCAVLSNEGKRQSHVSAQRNVSGVARTSVPVFVQERGHTCVLHDMTVLQMHKEGGAQRQGFSACAPSPCSAAQPKFQRIHHRLQTAPRPA